MTGRWFRLSSVGVMWIALHTGCAAYRAPSVDLVGLATLQTGEEAMAVEFTFGFTNPNTVPLSLDEFDYEVTMGGQRVYEGRWAAEATLAAQRRRELAIPAVLPWHLPAADQPEHDRDLTVSIKGSLGYRTPGKIAELLYDSHLWRPKAKLRASDLPVPDSPGVASSSP